MFLESGLAATSQIAFPQDMTAAVYQVDPYGAKGQNSSVASIDEDSVFSDGTRYQMASVTGNAQSQAMASLLVGIDI